MAFGGLKGTLSGNGNSTGASNSVTGSVSVAVGDLVFVVFGEQTNLTASAVSDSLGNSYSAVNAGTDAGAVTCRPFYSRVTVAGTLTTVTVSASSSNDDYACVAAVIEGPFVSSPLDAAPANITSDVTSPFTCPATGTRAQADEAVLGWGAANQTQSWSATSPNLLATNANNSSNIKVAVGYQAVSVTTTVSPAFTAAANPTQAVLGTASFKKDLTQALTPGLITNSQTLAAPSVSFAPLTPDILTNTQTFYVPSVAGLELNISPPLFTNQSGGGSAGLLLVLTGGSDQFKPADVSATPLSIGVPLFSNDQAFYAPTITEFITAPLFDNSASSGASGSPTGLLLVLTGSASQFLRPAITQSDPNISAALLDSAVAFFPPTIAGGEVGLTASLFSNTSTIYAASIDLGDNVVEASLTLGALTLVADGTGVIASAVGVVLGALTLVALCITATIGGAAVETYIINARRRGRR